MTVILTLLILVGILCIPALIAAAIRGGHQEGMDEEERRRRFRKAFWVTLLIEIALVVLVGGGICTATFFNSIGGS